MKIKKPAFFLAFILLALTMTACTPAKPFTVGSFNGNTYTNDYFGMNFTVPDDWNIMTGEQIKEITGATNEMLGKDVDLSKVKTIYLTYVMKYAYGYTGGFNPNMNLITTNLGLYGLAVKDSSHFLEQALEQMVKEMEGSEMTFELGDVTSQKTGGVDFAVVDSNTTYTGIEFKQRMYCTIRNNYAIMMTLTWMGDDGADGLESIVDSISFGK